MNDRKVLVKSCPNCGKNWQFVGVWMHFPFFKQITCGVCGYEGQKALTRKGAARKWNRALVERRNEDD